MLLQQYCATFVYHEIFNNVYLSELELELIEPLPSSRRTQTNTNSNGIPYSSETTCKLHSN